MLLVLAFYLPAEWVKAKPAPQPERYILPCLPFLAIALAHLWSKLSAGLSTYTRNILACCLIIFPLSRSLALARDIPYDTRQQCADWMKSKLQRGAPIYIDWQPYAPYFGADDFQVSYILRAHLIDRLTANHLKTSGKRYLILSSLFYDRYFSDPNGNPAAIRTVRRAFEQIPVIHECTSASGTYGFHNPRITVFSLDEADFARFESEIKNKELGRIERTSNEVLSSFPWRKPRPKI